MKLGLGLGNDLHGQSRGGVFGGLLLDQYSGAAAAYSLRKLSSGTTNVVRVRRNSDNTERDFTAKEVTDGTLETWVGANDGFVTTWYDQSGNGNDATQSTASEQPKIVDAGSLVTENGKAALDFDGVDDLLEAIVSIDISTAVSAFTSVADWSTGAMAALLSDASSSISDEYLQWVSIGRQVARYNRRPSGGTGNNTELAQQLYSGIYDGSGNITTYRNSSQIDTDVITPDPVPTVIRLRLGARNTSSLHSDANIQETIIYNSNQSANRTAIEDNINSYYNIY